MQATIRPLIPLLLVCSFACSGLDVPEPLRGALPAGAPQGVCQGVVHGAVLTDDAFLTDEYAWRDSQCNVRRVALTRNDGPDPAGHFGGAAHRFTYYADGVERRCVGSNPEHPGYGVAVTHGQDFPMDSAWQPGTYKSVLLGRHHAIHRFTTRYPIDQQPVTVSIDWMVATGRDHPVWAITYDAHEAPPDTIVADTRAPYGEVDYDEGAQADVAGVGWGDQRKFVSRGAPVGLGNGWDYTQMNTVPYVMTWTASPDAEMGFVQTQTFEQHDAGGYDFFSHWGQQSEGPMPPQASWTYQLNQYELPSTPRSKRLGWGSNAGAVGLRQYPAYGNARRLSGYPYQSYSGWVVLGRHRDLAVATTVAAAEGLQAMRLTAQSGVRVATSGPTGVARPDTAAYDPPGYDPIYATWVLERTAGTPIWRFVAPDAVRAPIFVVHGWSGSEPPRVTLDGNEVPADSGCFISLEATQLWVTLRGVFTGTHTVSLLPP